MANSNWNDESINALTELWQAGLKDGDIASELSNRFGCNFSRMAVLGKRARLGYKQTRDVGQSKDEKIVSDLVSFFKKSLKPIGGTNCISWFSLERKARIETIIDFNPAQLNKAINQLLISGNVTRVNKDYYYINAQKDKPLSLSELAISIHKIFEGRYA